MADKETARALNELIERNGHADVYSIWQKSQKAPLTQQVLSLLASSNKEVPVERRLLQSDVFAVVSRAWVTSLTASINADYRELQTIRIVNDFIKVALFNNTPKYCQDYLDLLPIGHPLSQKSPLHLTGEEVAQHKAIWLSADPRISEEYRPLVASAYLAKPDSVEKKYLLARLEALPQTSVPRDTLLGLIGY